MCSAKRTDFFFLAKINDARLRIFFSENRTQKGSISVYVVAKICQKIKKIKRPKIQHKSLNGIIFAVIMFVVML